jgi:outer membrane lipoprotein LolB
LKRLAAFVAALLLAGCSGQRVHDSQQTTDAGLANYGERRAGLLHHPDWAMEGRLSIDDGEDGGSGRISWQVNGQTTKIHFHAALGRGAWRLVMNGQGATLETADGRVLREPTANELLQKEIGWAVPVDALSWWARGLAAPDSEDQLHLDDAGLPARIMQQGWTVRYRRYGEFEGQLMPVRLEANKGDYRVKLAVSEWRFGHIDEG